MRSAKHTLCYIKWVAVTTALTWQVLPWAILLVVLIKE